MTNPRTSRRRDRRRAIGLLLLAGSVTSLATACGDDGVAANPDEPTIGVESLDAPGNRLADWKTYGTTLVVATVTGETEGETDLASAEANEGVVGRQVQVRIDERHWQDDSRGTEPEAARDFAMETLG